MTQRLSYKISDAVIEKRILKELYNKINNTDLLIGLNVPLQMRWFRDTGRTLLF